MLPHAEFRSQFEQKLHEMRRAHMESSEQLLYRKYLSKITDDLRQAVAIRDASPVELEASGGVNLQTVGEIAKTGIERISVGAVTHSAVALDFGLDWRLS